MILDISKLGAERLQCRICIIGAGAAGIALALKLAEEKMDVLLVAGGEYEETAADRKLHEGTADPQGSHEPLEEHRHRAFGGATKIWGGRLVPFDVIDFKRRPYMPLSGWPIKHNEIATHYPRAMELCETPASEFRRLSDPRQFDLPDVLGDGAIESTTLERWSTPTDFGNRYRGDLAASEHVRVLLSYHAINLNLTKGLEKVDTVYLASRRGPAIQVRADAFILATGGIENPRLLLASRNQLESGVGNQYDQVGRHYMGHISGTHGFIRLKSGSKRKPEFYSLAKDGLGVYSRRRFRLSDKAQKGLEVGNVIAFPMRPDISDPSHRDVVLSFLYLRQALSSGNRHGFPGWGSLARHACNCVFNNPLAWVSVAQQSWLRSRRPRLPFLLPYNSRSQDAIYFQAEHAPNPCSRLTLGDQVDEFGVPRISAQVRFSDIDYRTVLEFYRQLDQGLRSAELGFIDYSEAGLRLHLQRITEHFNSSAHHLGTTRMSADPKSGVVDGDCRVHSVRNLYLAGGSVFPTSSHANPTLTIIALALRLADRLAERLREPFAETTDGRLTSRVRDDLVAAGRRPQQGTEVSAAGATVFGPDATPASSQAGGAVSSR